MRNVHRRELPVPADVVGPLLDRLGGPDDVLWPSPAWPAMWVDGSLAVGAEAGHDDIRYVVSAYEPGRRVEFTFHRSCGMTGWHALEVHPLGLERSVLRHELLARPDGALMQVFVPLVIRWLHDAVLEDLLDNAERTVTGSVRRPARWSPWVRLLRRASRPRTRAVHPVPDARVSTALDRVDYTDAFSVSVTPGVTTDAVEWAAAMFRGMSEMPLLAVVDGEAISGADDEHISYRTGVAVRPEPERTVVMFVSVVQWHDRRGWLYFQSIRLGHRMMVRMLLRRGAIRLGSVPSGLAVVE